MPRRRRGSDDPCYTTISAEGRARLSAAMSARMRDPAIQAKAQRASSLAQAAKRIWQRNPMLVLELRAMWAFGAPASVIARALGRKYQIKVSRRAVIAKAYQLGLPRREPPPALAAITEERRRRKRELAACNSSRASPS